MALAVTTRISYILGRHKNAFMRNFFDEARAEDLRSKIATFAHEPTESFRSSWIRFKSYHRDCPHHGFNEVQLLSTFLQRYRSVVSDSS